MRSVKKKKKKKKAESQKRASIAFKYRGGIAYLYGLAVLHLLNRDVICILLQTFIFVFRKYVYSYWREIHTCE